MSFAAYVYFIVWLYLFYRAFDDASSMSTCFAVMEDGKTFSVYSTYPKRNDHRIYELSAAFQEWFFWGIAVFFAAIIILS